VKISTELFDKILIIFLRLTAILMEGASNVGPKKKPPYLLRRLIKYTRRLSSRTLLQRPLPTL